MTTETIPLAPLTRFAVRLDTELQVFSKGMESEVWRRKDWLERRLVAFRRYVCQASPMRVTEISIGLYGLTAAFPDGSKTY